MALKHFVKDRYNSIGEALLDIRKELQRLQPVDSGSIAWEQSETGMSAHVGDGSVGGSMPTDDVGAEAIKSDSINHPFKVSVSGTVCTITGGYIFGYNIHKVVPDTQYTITENTKYIYLQIFTQQEDLLFSYSYAGSDKEIPYATNVSATGGTYSYPLAYLKESEDGSAVWVQGQYGNIILPFTRSNMIRIAGSMNCLLQASYVHGIDYIDLSLREADGEDAFGVKYKAPTAFQKLTTTDGGSGSFGTGVFLKWEDDKESKTEIKINESLSNLLSVNDDGELTLSETAPAGRLLAVNALGDAVEWITVEAGSGGAALGVITVAGANNGYGVATWKPVVLASDGTYTADGSASSQTVIIPRS